VGRPSGAHTHPPSGLAVVGALALGGGLLWAVSRGSPAVHKAAHGASVLLHVLLLGALAALALALAAGVTCLLVVTRRHRPRQVERGWTATVDPAGPGADRRMRDLPPAPRSGPAMTALPPPSTRRLDPPPAGPREVHYHVHVDTPEGAQAVARALREHDH